MRLSGVMSTDDEDVDIEEQEGCELKTGEDVCRGSH